MQIPHEENLDQHDCWITARSPHPLSILSQLASHTFLHMPSSLLRPAGAGSHHSPYTLLFLLLLTELHLHPSFHVHSHLSHGPPALTPAGHRVGGGNRLDPVRAGRKRLMDAEEDGLTQHSHGHTAVSSCSTGMSAVYISP